MAGGRQGAPGFDPARLRAARERAQMTQSALAEAAGAHINEVGEWEAGRRVPRVETVGALARALRLDPVELLDVDAEAGLTLQQLRATAGLSQAAVAAAAGLQRTTYSAIERGESASLSPAAAAAIGRALSTSEQAVRAGHRHSRVKYLQRRPSGNGRAKGSTSSDR